MEELIYEIIDDLTTELKLTDENFDASLLEVKVRGAVREVLQELGLSGNMNSVDPAKVNPYYSNIRNIALYDYNMVGAEFQTSIVESSTTRHYSDRNKLFVGILPLARV